MDLHAKNGVLTNAAMVVSFETRTFTSPKPIEYAPLLNYMRNDSRLVSWITDTKIKDVAVLENSSNVYMGQSPSPWFNTPENNPFKEFELGREFLDKGITFH